MSPSSVFTTLHNGSFIKVVHTQSSLGQGMSLVCAAERQCSASQAAEGEVYNCTVGEIGQWSTPVQLCTLVLSTAQSETSLCFPVYSSN